MAGIGASGLDRTQSTEAVDQQASTGAARRLGRGGTDQVSLSRLAEQLKALDSQSPERQARLDQLAAAYQAGEYNPDPEAVGDAVIDDALAWGQDLDGAG